MTPRGLLLGPHRDFFFRVLHKSCGSSGFSPPGVHFAPGLMCRRYAGLGGHSGRIGGIPGGGSRTRVCGSACRSRRWRRPCNGGIPRNAYRRFNQCGCGAGSRSRGCQRGMVVKAAGCAGQGILILAWLETRDHFNPFALRAFQSRLSRASMVKSCRRARGLNPFTLNSCPPHSSRSEASSSCRPRRTQWPLVLQTGWRLRYLWRRWVQLVHFCCEARFTHSVVAPEILDRYCQHDSPHQGGLSPPLAGG